MAVRYRRVLMAVLAAALATSCVAHRQIPVVLSATPPTASEIADQVSVDDVVRVELTSGQRLTMSVRRMTADALFGDNGRRIPYTDIVRLEREGVDGKMTLLLNLPFTLFMLFAMWGLSSG